MNTKKFSDNGESNHNFIKNVLVICPQCKKCAHGFTNPTKIICSQCGFCKDYKVYNYGNDTFCGELLWLKAGCCGEILWAYNQEHLEFIEQYIYATLRKRKPNINQSVASRLPRWLTKSTNRKKVLKSIKVLKNRLEAVY